MAANPPLAAQSAADPLASLKPLLAPAPVSTWPAAPGWWILGALLLVILIVAAVWGWRRWRRYVHTRYQRDAIALLAALPDTDPAQRLQAIAEILRRAAVSAIGRERAATASWPDILRQYPGTPQATLDADAIALLTQTQYRLTPPDAAAVARLQTQAAAWVCTLPPRES